MGIFSKLFGSTTKEESGKVSKVKLAVIFYSMGGTNFQLAKWAAEGGREAGAEVKILKVEELAPESVIQQNEAWKATVEQKMCLLQHLKISSGRMLLSSVYRLDLETCHHK